MKTLFLVINVMMIVILFICTLKSDQLENRHQITLGIGVWNHEYNPVIKTGFNKRGAMMETNGFTGRLSWKYFLSDKLATNISFGLRSAVFNSSINMDSTYFDAVSVYHVLFGINYYPSILKNFSPLRPFITAQIGPYIAILSIDRTKPFLEITSKTETTFGGRFGAGFDFLMGKGFSLGLGVGYHYMAIKNTIRENDNYNGPELTVDVSYFIGKRFNRSQTTN